MPVFLDYPKRVDKGISAEVRLTALYPIIPDNAAIAIMYYVNSSYQGTPGTWICADYWYPNLVEGASLETYGWVMTAYTKSFFLTNLGPNGSNPDKYVYTGVRYGDPTPTIYVVGYFTYEEVTLMPEITSSNRADYAIPIDDWAIGLANTPIAANIWDIPTLNMLDNKTATAIIFDGQYDSTLIFDKNADQSYLNTVNAVRPYSNIGGFSSNGDVWLVKSGTTFGVMGYLTIPATWGLSLSKYENKVDFWRSGLEYRHQFNGNVGVAIIDLKGSVQEWSIRGAKPQLDVVPHYPIANTYPQSRTHVLAPVDSLFNDEVVFEGVSTTPEILTDTVFSGFISKYYDSYVSTALGISEISFTGPDLYYPPDNFGSLQINYTIQGQTYTYQNYLDMVIYLSGGVGNPTPSLSLGGDASTVELSSGFNSLFPDTDLFDAAIGLTTYRCIYLKNASSTYDAVGIGLWVDKEVGTTGNMIYVGMDPAGVNGVAQTVATDTTAPSGVGFILATSEDTCYNLPKLTQQSSVAVWFKRVFVVGASDQRTPDTASINISVLNNKV